VAEAFLTESNRILSAFVLMPFNEEATAIFDQLIAEPLIEVGYDVRRADSVIDQQSVLSDIVQGINGADLIVADLTDLNPNVFYELGIAHGLGVPTVLITQSLDEVPFDLKSYRTSEYSARFDEAEKLKGFLKEVGNEAAGGRVKFASPVSDFLRESPAARRLSRYEGEGPIAEIQAPEQTSQDVDIEAEPGILDFLHFYVMSAEKTVASLGRINSETSAIGDRIASHTERMNSATATDKPGGVAQMHRIATDVATDLSAYGDVLKQEVPVLEEQSALMIDNGLKWLSAAGDVQPEDELEGFRISLATMYLVLATSIPQSRSYRDSFKEVRGMTSQLNKAADRVISYLGRLLTVMEKSQSFAGRGCDIAQELGKADALHLVGESEIRCFHDPQGTEEQPFTAILIATFDRGVEEVVLPYAGEPLPKRSVVSWAVDDNDEYPESWYLDPYSETIQRAWERAPRFVGVELRSPQDDVGDEPAPDAS
jgi:hypothetical protein